MPSYNIIRYSKHDPTWQRVVGNMPTLEDARAHCQDPATENDDYFDGYMEIPDPVTLDVELQLNQAEVFYLRGLSSGAHTGALVPPPLALIIAHLVEAVVEYDNAEAALVARREHWEQSTHDRTDERAGLR